VDLREIAPAIPKSDALERRDAVVPVGSPLRGEELDCEADRSLRLDEVLDVRRDALRMMRVDDDIDHGCRLSHEAETTLIDAQTAPHSARHPVSSAQRVRHGVLIPLRRRPNDDKVSGDLGPIAQRTRQR
jgi:hypothetical protein